MKCPRRFDDAGVFTLLAGEDEWCMRDGYPLCSYCGSLSPEALFNAIKEGVQIEPTDKNYKIYIRLPAKNPDELHVFSTCNYDPKDECYKRVADLPQPLYQRVVEEGWGTAPETTWVRLETRSKVFAKFYFQHLDVVQQGRFVDMMNSKTLNIGPPGHFYRLPYFVTR